MVEVIKGTDTLQNVTDVGNTTSNAIIHSDGVTSVVMKRTGTTGNIGTSSPSVLDIIISNIPQARLSSGGLCVGTSTGNAVSSAQLQVVATTKGFLMPVLTTAQRDAIVAPATGLMIYNSSTNKLCVYTGAAWETITSA